MRNYQSIDENNEAYVTTLALGKKYVAVVPLIISCSQQASYLPHLPNIKVSHTHCHRLSVNTYITKKAVAQAISMVLKSRSFRDLTYLERLLIIQFLQIKNKLIRLWGPSRQYSSTKQAGPAAMSLLISCSNRLQQPCKKMSDATIWTV